MHMRDLAPHILRQRLLIEGLYTIDLDREQVAAYLTGVAAHLDLRAYGEPAIHSPAGEGKQQNQGFDAFLPLIDSGIAAYAWTAARFFSIVLYTCKSFDTQAAVDFTRRFFAASELEFARF
jgi:S-adenosylmethionine decarboxylase